MDRQRHNGSKGTINFVCCLRFMCVDVYMYVCICVYVHLRYWYLVVYYLIIDIGRNFGFELCVQG